MNAEAQQVLDRIRAAYAENPNARVDWGSSMIYRLCAQHDEFAKALIELDEPRQEAALLEAERSRWRSHSTSHD